MPPPLLPDPPKLLPPLLLPLPLLEPPELDPPNPPLDPPELLEPPLPLRLPLWPEPAAFCVFRSLMLLSFCAMVILLRWTATQTHGACPFQLFSSATRPSVPVALVSHSRA